MTELIASIHPIFQVFLEIEFYFNGKHIDLEKTKDTKKIIILYLEAIRSLKKKI
jgi:hypothetical protein